MARRNYGLLALTLFLLTCITCTNDVFAGVKITGAGATFPYPIYAKWAYSYGKLTGARINYQSIGSGGGIQQIKAGTVDFGASDAPLEADELERFGLIQFPMVIGGVVPVLNLKGIKNGQLKMTGEVLSCIYLGKIKKWDDPRIVALNPGLDLPSRSITVVHRSDGSGTTWIFTRYLSQVNDEWKKSVGFGKAVQWPAGVGGKGNEGVAAYAKRINGALAYVEYAYAIQNRLNPVALKNKDGSFVLPSAKTFEAAASNADWEHAPGLGVVLTNQPGKDSWPITGASFILMRKNQNDLKRAQAVLKFFDWCYHDGRKAALKLDYIPVPLKVVDIVEKLWANSLKASGRPVWPIKQ